MHPGLLIYAEESFQGRMGESFVFKQGQDHGDGDTVVAAQRRAVCGHIIAVDGDVQPVYLKVERLFGFAHHVQMPLKQDRGVALVTR